MQINEIIAKYRRARGMTQEELGERLGVSNQAVSKWENAVSLPDITLLPALARALGITLDILLGEAEETEPEYLHPDAVPNAAYDALHRTFDRFLRHGTGSADARIDQRKDKLANLQSYLMECTSDTCGAVMLTDSFSFVDRTFRQPGSEAPFLSRRLAAVLERMAEENTRKRWPSSAAKPLPGRTIRRFRWRRLWKTAHLTKKRQSTPCFHWRACTWSKLRKTRTIPSAISAPPTLFVRWICSSWPVC